MQQTPGRRRKRANRLHRRLMYPLEYLVVRAAIAVIQSLPRESAYALGRFLGRLAFKIDARHRDIGLLHVEEAFGESLSPAERESLIRRVYENLGMNIVDLAILPRILRKETVLRLVRFPDGHERLLEVARDRGA